MKTYCGGSCRKQKKRQRICLGTALVLAVLVTAGLLMQRGALVEARTEKAQNKLAEEVLRFHVLADSDEPDDQKLKLQVRDAVLLYIREELTEQTDLQETCAWVQKHLGDLEQTAEDKLEEEGCTDSVRAELVKDYFPEKSYGDITFPAGEYMALRIRIGQAAGHNWWCCLYPSLCFTDAAAASAPEEEMEQFGRVLGEDEYDMITAFSDFKIKWFFFGGGSGDAK